MGRALSRALIDVLSARFKVLAESARLTLLQALRNGERSVSQLVDASGMSQANVSKHLQALLAAGFVQRRKHGVFAYYSITTPDILRVCDLMCGQLESELNRRRRFLGALDSTG